MAITVPIPGDEISASTFGGPVANALNRMGGTWRRAANQSIPSAAWTAIAWDTELADSHGFLTPTGTTVTIPAGGDGLYALTASAYTGLNATARLLITGVSDNFTGVPDPVTGCCCPAVTLPLVAGNTIQVQIYQSSGSAINTNGRLELWRVGI